jgi:hypothetical protein
MVEPTLLMPELRAAQQAIGYLEAGDSAAALKVLREVMKRRRPPPPGEPDTRPKEVVWSRRHIEPVIQALEKYPEDLSWPLKELRKGMAAPPVK